MNVEADLFIDWRNALVNVAPNEGDKLEHLYLATPDGKIPRDMTTDEIMANYQEVRKANVTEINGLFELGCFQRWPRSRSHKMIDGNLGANCMLTVRGFKDEFQDLDAYAGTTGRSGQRLVNAVAAENPDFILFSLDVS